MALWDAFQRAKDQDEMLYSGVLKEDDIFLQTRRSPQCMHVKTYIKYGTSEKECYEMLDELHDRTRAWVNRLFHPEDNSKKVKDLTAEIEAARLQAGMMDMAL